MNNEQPPQTQVEKPNYKELLLSNPAFRRLARGFEVYQEVLHNQKNETDRDLVIERMRRLYDPQLNNVDIDSIDEKEYKIATEIKQATLQECYENNFSIEKLASRIAASPFASSVSKGWVHKAGEFDERLGINYINEVVAYKKEDDSTISLHIQPTSLETPAFIISIVDGLKTIKSKLDNGEIEAENVVMKSWLLSKALEEKVRLILGQDVIIKDVAPNDNEIADIQYQAIQNNGRSMKTYLETGEKPEVREIHMTKDEFIAQLTKF